MLYRVRMHEPMCAMDVEIIAKLCARSVRVATDTIKAYVDQYILIRTCCANQYTPLPIGEWDVSNVTSMRSVFANCTTFNESIADWDTGAVTDMREMFCSATTFNQPLNTWNTAAVTNMREMFRGATAFNQPLNNWNTAAVTDMREMFCSATAFNQPLNTWNTAAVTNMCEMFRGASAFHQPLSDWNTSAVITMWGMFWHATAFNQPLNTWNTAAVTDMGSMFCVALTFNQPLNNWNTAAVTNMYDMFHGAGAFNQPLSAWNVSRVRDMANMFMQASSFNQPLDRWNVSNVRNLRNMFCNATTFNQPVFSLEIHTTTSIASIFRNCPFWHPLRWTVLGEQRAASTLFEDRAAMLARFHHVLGRAPNAATIAAVSEAAEATTLQDQLAAYNALFPIYRRVNANEAMCAVRLYESTPSSVMLNNIIRGTMEIPELRAMMVDAAYAQSVAAATTAPRYITTQTLPDGRPAKIRLQRQEREDIRAWSVALPELLQHELQATRNLNASRKRKRCDETTRVANVDSEHN